MTRWVIVGWTWLMLLLVIQPVEAGQTAASWLPPDTKGFITIPDVARLKNDWKGTQLGQLLSDPAMKPFVEQLWQRIRSELSETYHALALDWPTIERLAHRELAVAVRQPDGEDSHAIILLIQVNNTSPVQQIMELVDRHWTTRAAVRSTETVGPAKVTSYQIAAANGRSLWRHAYYTVVSGWFIASDNHPTLEYVVRRVAGESLPALADQESYRVTQDRTALQDGTMEPHVRWYVEPFGYARIVRAVTRQERQRGTDILKVIQEQGFGDIQAIGGQIALLAGPYQILHRTLVYLPEPRRAAARILDFPNGPVLDPPAWVPADVANYAAFRWNLQQAFASIGSLVDALTNDGFFEEFLVNLEQDPKGPQVNLRRELVEHLGQHIVFVSHGDHRAPSPGERFAVAIELKNERVVAAAIEKMLRNDRTSIRHDRNGLVLWQMTTTQDEPEIMLTVEIDTTPGFNFGTPRQEENVPEQVPSLPETAVAVAAGLLWIASDVDYIEELVRIAGTSSLAAERDYQRVCAALEQLGAGQEALRVFSRSDKTYEATYELLREGRLEESHSLLGKLLNQLSSPERPMHKNQANGYNLPPFDQVRKYLGPAGIYSQQHAYGWTITGCLLEAETR